LVVNRTTVSSNAAGTWTGGIRNYGFAQIIDTTVSNNSAVNGSAGISNRPGGNMTIAGTTVWGNTTPGRTGGIANAGAMTVTNTTVSANEAGDLPGGIANLATGSMSLLSTTVSGNTSFSGPSAIQNDGGMTLRNNIIDGDCLLNPPWGSFGGNIESPGNTCGLIPGVDLFDVSTAQLGLAPLGDNGGPTWTHALLPGSVAIDFAEECVNAAGFPLLVDQRGAVRPHGPACDAGAFELGGVLLPRDQCVNDADRNAYESLSYINRNGYLLTCIDAAGEMATDCIFGSAQSSPSIVGCPAQAADVIACYPSCPPETFEAFGDCVASCTTEVTGLSAECAGCYGALAECAAQACLVECASAPYSQECDLCRGQSGCNMIYDACTGLPGNTDCPAVPDLCAGVDCDDGNQCTVGVCDPPTGECIIDNVPYGSLCDLGVGYGSCENGVCVPGG
jgi:hypothetical protein